MRTLDFFYVIHVPHGNSSFLYNPHENVADYVRRKTFVLLYLKISKFLAYMLQYLCERKAEWLGNDNRKPMIKVKTIGQILTFKSGAALPSPSQPGYAIGMGTK